MESITMRLISSNDTVREHAQEERITDRLVGILTPGQQHTTKLTHFNGTEGMTYADALDTLDRLAEKGIVTIDRAASTVTYVKYAA